MKKLTLAVVLAALSVTAQAGTLDTMRLWTSSYEAAGFKEAFHRNQDATAQLTSGEVRSINFNLTAGMAYAFAGACDDNCGDLDLTLYDPNGNEVSSDGAVDAIPAVFTYVTQSGTYRLEANMYECSASSCEYRVRAYSKAESPAERFKGLMDRKITER